eukprot:symbB.v1.2.024911.t1/scaffold2390.1/size80330/10
MSPAAQSATAALFAAVAAATKLSGPKEVVEAGEKERSETVKELQESLQDIQRRIAHVVRQTRIVAAECHALDERMAGLALAQRRRELEVATVWQDLQAAVCHAKEVLRHHATQEPSQRRAQIEEKPKDKQLQSNFSGSGKMRRRHAILRLEQLRSQEIQREMDEIQRLQALLSHARARELLGGEPADPSAQLTLTRVNTGRERKTR